MVAEQLINRHDVVDHCLVVDGGAKDCLTFNEGDSVAHKEVVPGLFGLLLYAWVWQLHMLTKLEVMILT